MTDQPRPFYERISDALEVVSDLRAAGAHGSALEVLEDTARDAIPYLQALEARKERLTAALNQIRKTYTRETWAGQLADEALAEPSQEGLNDEPLPRLYGLAHTVERETRMQQEQALRDG